MKLVRYGREIEQLGQRYRLQAPLGSGGMADVCLAWDEQEERAVAIKVIKPDELDQRSLDRFLKEAAQIARWQHPNILRIYSDLKLELLDPQQGAIIPYIVMEYAEGGDLHKRLTPGKPYPLAETLHIFAQLCSAVAYAHQHGIIHRDLKPLNTLFRVLPDGTEQLVLSDFGIAVEIDASHHTFARGGTLPYMAPEQLQGRPEAASDIFALGVILYQLCTGKLPFKRSLQDMLPSAPPRVPLLPSSIVPTLPPALDDVILTALAHEPSERYATATEFWESVRAALPRRSRTASRSPRTTATASGQSTTEVRRPPSTQPQRSMPTIRKDIPSAEIEIQSEQDLSSDEDEYISGRSNTRSRSGTARSPIPSRSPDSLRSRATSPQPVPTRYLSTPNSGYDIDSPNEPPSPSRRTPSRSPSKPLHAPRPPLPALLRGQRRARSRAIIAAAALIIIVGILVYNVNSRLPGSKGVLPLPTLPIPGTALATVTITPSSSTITDTYTFTGTAGATPDPAQRQIAVRQISSPAESLSKLTTPTGQVQIPATTATGQLTFLNGSFTTPFTVAAGTMFSGTTGVQVVNDVAATIPPANPTAGTEGSVTVAAHAVNAGLNGNIPAKDINHACCGAGNTILVQNNSAFAGGGQGGTFSFLQQSDVDGVVNSLKGQLMQQAQAALQGQVHANEQLAGTPNCPITPNMDRPVGARFPKVIDVNITVSVTCSAAVYDQQGVRTLATGLLKSKASASVGSGFALAGNVVLQTTVQNASQGSVTLNVAARGLWVYQFTNAQKQALVQQIVGKRVTDVKALLKNQSGVGDASVQVSGDVLPRDPAQISLVVQDVPGMQG